VPIITAARVVTPDGVLAPGAVEVDDGVIVAVEPVATAAPDWTLAPGFIDIQCNGFDDIDVAQARDDRDWDRLAAHLSRQGVTAWCPTVITRPLDRYGEVLARIEGAARRGLSEDGMPLPAMLGVHLEGPFLGGAPGAHDVDLIAPIDLGFLRALPDLVRIVTLAPEQPDARTAIAELRARGIVVALGHSTASYEDARAAVNAGAQLVTHCFNGMSAFHHRRPGLLGAALTDDRVAVSLIADLQHVHPAGISLAFRAKPQGQIILVSDAIAWRGIGTHLPDGTLVGATVGLDTAVRNAVLAAHVDLVDAIEAASTAPARLLGDHGRGRIAVGARADLVALDGDLRVARTWIAGQPIL